MSPVLQITLLFVFAAACIAMLWRTQWLPLAVTVVAAERQQGPKHPDDPGEEQLPETDRAPKATSHLLAYTVALTAAVRIAVLLAFQR